MHEASTSIVEVQGTCMECIRHRERDKALKQSHTHTHTQRRAVRCDRAFAWAVLTGVSELTKESRGGMMPWLMT